MFLLFFLCKGFCYNSDSIFKLLNILFNVKLVVLEFALVDEKLAKRILNWMGLSVNILSDDPKSINCSIVFNLMQWVHFFLQ